MPASTRTKRKSFAASSSQATDFPKRCGRFPRKLASFAGPGDGISGLAVSRAAAIGFALVPQLFSLGQGKFNLHSAVFEVHASGNESQSLLLGFADEPANFLLVDKQLAGAQRRVAEDVAM